MKQLGLLLLYAACPLWVFCQLNNNKNEPAIHYPVAKTVDTVDTYFGIKVPDPYRWLEQSASTPDVNEWIEAENKVTDAYLSQIPFRSKIKDELTSFLNYEKISAPDRHGSYYYFTKNSGLQNQSVWYRTKDPADLSSAEVFLDPNEFYDNGAFTFQGFSFTHDGTLCAYLLSPRGSDWRVALIMDVATKKFIGDTIRDIKFSGISWKGDEGFYYSTYDIPKGENRLTYETTEQTVYYHKMGTPQSEDQFVFGGNKNPNRYISADVSEDGHYLQIYTANSTTNNQLFIQDLTSADAPIIPVVADYNSTQYIVTNDGSTLFIYTNLDAPFFRLVKVDAANPGPENWKDVIPETKYVMNVSSGGGYFFVTYNKDVKDVAYQYSYGGKQIREIKLPAAGSISGLGAWKEDTGFYYTFNSFTYPGVIYHYDIKTGRSTFFWKPKMNFNPADYETKQVFYPSKDGTKIPMYIVYKKGTKLDGKNPVFLTAYGGFGISLMPEFVGPYAVWLNHGGIFAQPNLRGGGEYGLAWHLAGTRMHKQNVFDDFIAAGEYLIKEKYTSSDYLAIAGGSNGGLLVGATMTQRPDLMKVALPSVGVLDMLRYNKFTAGAGWAFDYGTAEDSLAMFKYLLGYSPVQHIKKGVHYPATLVWTADHDDRVVPAHSFKFAATLQADNAGNDPVLLQVQRNIGHGTGMVLSQAIERLADEMAFAWYNMGLHPY
jgi:prolyl oligopeptidase